MRIAIITIGSRGDVQPFVALGQGLIKAGHTVRLVTHQDFEVFVESHGLEFWLIRGNPQVRGVCKCARGKLIHCQSSSVFLRG